MDGRMSLRNRKDLHPEDLSNVKLYLTLETPSMNEVTEDIMQNNML